MSESHMPFGERRLHERKSCTRVIQVNDFSTVYHGHLRDLTVGGAFIEPPEGNEARIGQSLILTIPFGLKHDILTLRARVAWVKSLGMGVRFVK